MNLIYDLAPPQRYALPGTVLSLLYCITLHHTRGYPGLVRCTHQGSLPHCVCILIPLFPSAPGSTDLVTLRVCALCFRLLRPAAASFAFVGRSSVLPRYRALSPSVYSPFNSRGLALVGTPALASPSSSSVSAVSERVHETLLDGARQQ